MRDSVEYRLCVGAVLLIILCMGTTWASEQAIPNESGFEGAVRVRSRENLNGLVVVTVEIPYRDVRGATRRGLGRFMARASDLAGDEPLPAFAHVHYSMEIEKARTWCEQGWAVITPYYDPPEYPIDIAVGNSNNFTRALLQWVRRMPGIDPMRMHLDGGSQGGYMALAMAAEFFPITSLTADFPIVNWAYTLAYLEANRGLAVHDEPESSPMPLLAAIVPLANWAYQYFGPNLGNESWLMVSPITFADRIANPVLIQCATGDMLTPHEQITRQTPRPPSHDGFPEGYRRALDDLAPTPGTRVSLEAVIPDEMLWIQTHPRQEDSFEVTLGHFLGEESEPAGSESMDLPWSPEHQWSIVVLDEGSPAPFSGHTRYRWALSKDAFVAAHQSERAPLETLTFPLLDRLLQRYVGELEGMPALTDGVPVNRLNFELLERLDVLETLVAYADLSDDHAARLNFLYNQTMRKPLGDMLSFYGLEMARDELREELGLD